MPTLLPLMLVACALHTQKTGLVQLEEERVTLVDPGGRTWRVVAEGEAAPLRHLEGARVSVEGRRCGRRLYPRDWAVLDAGEGSAPFVGVLRRHGSNWIIEDRNSGSTIILAEASMGELRAHEGEVVLVVGYVVGAHRVNVVRWKALEP